MINIKDLFDWFLSQTKLNKILILVLAINILFYVDNQTLKDENKRILESQKLNDSIYIVRLTSIQVDFQRKIDECNEERMQSHIKQSEMWQKKFEELFEETDNFYKRYRESVKSKK